MLGVIALVVTLLVAQAPEHSATPSSGCSGFTSSSAFCGGVEYVPLTPSASPSTGSAQLTGGSGSGKTYLPYDKVMVGQDGQPCIGTGYYEEGTPHPRPVQGPSELEEGPGNSSSLYSTAPPCPPQARAPGQTGPVETPAMVARRYWEEIPLPVPRPRIAPGRAITGKLAYLETNGEVRHVYTNSTIFGPLEIVATGMYSIDWGDGDSSGPHAFEGKPWPDGRITHEYQEVGTYDIVVTERWTATWRLGGQSGVLRELRTTGRIDNFPVEQIQAVIGR